MDETSVRKRRVAHCWLCKRTNAQCGGDNRPCPSTILRALSVRWQYVRHYGQLVRGAVRYYWPPENEVDAGSMINFINQREQYSSVMSKNFDKVCASCAH